jgi:hypothetical protein
MERPSSHSYQDVILNASEAGVKDHTTLEATMQWTGPYNCMQASGPSQRHCQCMTS